MLLKKRCDFCSKLVDKTHGRGIALELLECADMSTCDAAVNCLNHLAFRVDDMDEFVSFLAEKGIEVEAAPSIPRWRLTGRSEKKMMTCSRSMAMEDCN